MFIRNTRVRKYFYGENKPRICQIERTEKE